MNAREIVYQYLLACYEDAHIVSQAEKQQQTFFDTMATPGLKHRRESQRNGYLKDLNQPLASPDSYRLVRESKDLVVFEVDSAQNLTPPLATRLVVTRTNDTWLLNDILWPCQCKNGECGLCENGSCSSCEKGRCCHCSGTGICKNNWLLKRQCSLCDGSGTCFLCDGQWECKYCNGTSKCKDCSQSLMPGWSSTCSIAG